MEGVDVYLKANVLPLSFAFHLPLIIFFFLGVWIKG
jgi:hypothetical protein